MRNNLLPPVNPTNADIYHKLGTLEGKFDAYIKHALPKRVSSLERTRAWVMGVSAAIGAVIISFSTFLRIE